MSRIQYALVTIAFLALPPLGCASETMECDGVIVAGECHPCPGTIVNGICVTGGADVREQECTIDEECLPVGVCLDGVCGKECTVDEDCPGILHCEFYRCVVDSPPQDVVDDTSVPIPCTKHIDCDPYEMACIDGFCDRECTQDWHCEEPGQVCQGYVCKDTSVPPDVPPTDSVTEPDLPANCQPTDGPYGAACDCKQECASSLCIQNKLTEMGMCTQYCQTDGQCPESDVCINVGEASVCVLNDSGMPTSCNPDQAICYKGLFLTNKLGDCACTTPCTSAADCPDGFGCHVLGADKACVQTGANCGTGYNPCFGQCAGDPNTGIGFCTNICITSTDCPNNWTCQPIADGVSICASPF